LVVVAPPFEPPFETLWSLATTRVDGLGITVFTRSRPWGVEGLVTEAARPFAGVPFEGVLALSICGEVAFAKASSAFAGTVFGLLPEGSTLADFKSTADDTAVSISIKNVPPPLDAAFESLGILPLPDVVDVCVGAEATEIINYLHSLQS
jgi:hypothetical protein